MLFLESVLVCVLQRNRGNKRYRYRWIYYEELVHEVREVPRSILSKLTGDPGEPII